MVTPLAQIQLAGCWQSIVDRADGVPPEPALITRYADAGATRCVFLSLPAAGADEVLPNLRQYTAAMRSIGGQLPGNAEIWWKPASPASPASPVISVIAVWGDANSGWVTLMTLLTHGTGDCLAHQVALDIPNGGSLPAAGKVQEGSRRSCCPGEV